MRGILLGILLLLAALACAQGRYDANWAFGSNCGLKFHENDSISLFEPDIFNVEAAASYSDSLGRLLFYAGFRENIKVFDKNTNVLTNGDFLNAHMSNTNGLIILDFPADSTYYLFTLDYGMNNTCGALPCDSLYFCKIKSTTDPQIITKNNRLDRGPFHEKLAAVKHTNGSDWWLILRNAYTTSISPNTYTIFQVDSDTINSYVFSNIGYEATNSNNQVGEMTVNRSGSLIAIVYSEDQVIELLEFDRCSGELNHLYELTFNPFVPYGIEFAQTDTVLYVSGFVDGGGGLSQITFNSNFTNHNIQNLWSADPNINVGQLQMAPDGKIYLSCFRNGLPSDTVTQYLSVINNPDSIGLACDFQPFKLYLGDSSRAVAGLPNMPNYNLGATTIYQADAGVDTFFCEGDTTIKGIQIGADPIAGVSYNWTNSSISPSSKESSRVFVSPTQSTWYYLELSDTSITGSCTSRIDSVLVEVRNCADTLNDIGIKDSDLSYVSIYPNPAQDKLHIQGLPQNEVVSFKLLNFQGQQVYRQQLDQAAVIDISQLASGIYIYTLTTQKGVTTGKVLLK